MKLSVQLLAGIIFSATITTGLPAFSVETPSSEGVFIDKHSAYRPLKGKSAPPDNDYDTLTLDMVRDVGVSLRQVRELSVYIFKEATRKQIALDDPPNLTGFDKISEKDIESGAKYLNPRPGWIYFYVGTLEPTIQLLKDAETEKVYIPKKIKNEASHLACDFNKELDKTKVEIKKLHKFIDSDTHDSVAVANAALAIYNSALAMEKIRTESYEFVRDAETKGYKDMVLF